MIATTADLDFVGSDEDSAPSNGHRTLAQVLRDLRRDTEEALASIESRASRPLGLPGEGGHGRDRSDP